MEDILFDIQIKISNFAPIVTEGAYASSELIIGMIDKNEVKKIVEEAIADTDAFIVDITVSKDDDIVVELDSATGADLDLCVAVSDKINAALDRDKEDYSLEVGTSSLTAPFKVAGQWEKNIGNTVEVLTTDSKKIVGRLESYTPEAVTIVTVQKVKAPGEKRPKLTEVVQELPMQNIREARYHIEFK